MTETVKVVRTKAYLVQVSRGNPIQIDEDELPKILAAMQSGSPAILKQGIVNPSYITSVVPDKERISLWLEDTKYDGSKRALGIKPLAELIDRTEVLKSIAAHKGGSAPRLGTGQ